MGCFFAASSNVACLIQRCHAAYSTRCRSAAVTHLIRRNIHHDPSSRRNAVWRSRLRLAYTGSGQSDRPAHSWVDPEPAEPAIPWSEDNALQTTVTANEVHPQC